MSASVTPSHGSSRFKKTAARWIAGPIAYRMRTPVMSAMRFSVWTTVAWTDDSHCRATVAGGSSPHAVRLYWMNLRWNREVQAYRLYTVCQAFQLYRLN